MSITFYEKYQNCNTWQERALVMALYHSSMSVRSRWSIGKTAYYFGVSIGLVSENLRLANAINSDELKYMSLKTRQEALDWMNK